MTFRYKGFEISDEAIHDMEYLGFSVELLISVIDESGFHYGHFELEKFESKIGSAFTRTFTLNIRQNAEQQEKEAAMNQTKSKTNHGIRVLSAHNEMTKNSFIPALKIELQIEYTAQRECENGEDLMKLKAEMFDCIIDQATDLLGRKNETV